MKTINDIKEDLVAAGKTQMEIDTIINKITYSEMTKCDRPLSTRLKISTIINDVLKIDRKDFRNYSYCNSRITAIVTRTDTDVSVTFAFCHPDDIVKYNSIGRKEFRRLGIFAALENKLKNRYTYTFKRYSEFDSEAYAYIAFKKNIKEFPSLYQTAEAVIEIY